MNTQQVAKILLSMGLPDKASPYGFDLGSLRDFYGIRLFRLERGSGIAGRGELWTLVEIATGEAREPACRTEKELRRVLREWLAGPKPLYPGNWYVRMNHRTWNDAYVWIRR